MKIIVLYHVCKDNFTLFLDDLYWTCEECSSTSSDQSIIVQNYMDQPTRSSVSTDISLNVDQNIRVELEFEDFIANFPRAQVILDTATGFPEFWVCTPMHFTVCG